MQQAHPCTFVVSSSYPSGVKAIFPPCCNSLGQIEVLPYQLFELHHTFVSSHTLESSVRPLC